MTLTRESDHQRGLRSVVGELIEHVRHYDIPDEPSYAAFVDAWADRIHAASGVPRMQQQMAEDRKALAAVRAEQAAEVERLRALAPSWVAFAHGYAHQPDWHSESDWRDCESYPCNEARAALAATPVAPAPAATERWTLVPGEDDDCPRCGRVKLRWVPPEYEPGGWVCDDCGWDSRDSRPVAPAPAEPRP